MDDNRIIPFHVEHADLQHRAATYWPDDHCQIVVHHHQAYGVADGMSDIRIGNSMLAGRPTEPHVDNLSCLEGGRHPSSRT